MKLTVFFVRETKQFACYETHDIESAFKTNLSVVKLWVPKSEFRPSGETGEELNAPGVYPDTLEIEIKVG